MRVRGSSPPSELIETSPFGEPRGADVSEVPRTRRVALRELRAAVLAKQKAEADLRDLYREREIQRARAAERDPAALLN